MSQNTEEMYKNTEEMSEEKHSTSPAGIVCRGLRTKD